VKVNGGESTAVALEPKIGASAVLAAKAARSVSLDLAHVDGVGALGPFADFELDGVAVTNFALYLGLVNKEVGTSFLLDESEAFDLVEPLHGTLCHVILRLGLYYFSVVVDEFAWPTENNGYQPPLGCAMGDGLVFAYLLLKEHPYGREMLAQLLSEGFVPAIIIEEDSAIGDEEREKFLARIAGNPSPRLSSSRWLDSRWATSPCRSTILRRSCRTFVILNWTWSGVR
jgi:hypothetical protein